MRLLNYLLIDYRKKHRVCYDCGTSVSVKYDANVEVKGQVLTIPLCNMCVLKNLEKKEK